MPTPTAAAILIHAAVDFAAAERSLPEKVASPLFRNSHANGSISFRS